MYHMKYTLKLAGWYPLYMYTNHKKQLLHFNASDELLRIFNTKLANYLYLHRETELVCNWKLLHIKNWIYVGVIVVVCAPPSPQNIWKPLDISLITIVIVQQQPQRWPRNCEALEAAKGNRKCNGPMHLLQHHLKTEADKWCFWATAHSGQRASVTLNENHFVCIEKLKPCYTMFNCMYLSGIFLRRDIYAIGW